MVGDVAADAGDIDLALARRDAPRRQGAASRMVVGLVRGWQLSLVIICFLPVMALSALLIAKGARLEAEQSWYARAGAVAEEVLFSMRTVAAFGAERRRKRVIQALFDISVPRARVPEKRPRVESAPRYDRSSKN